jgi:hypothetical protein
MERFKRCALQLVAHAGLLMLFGVINDFSSPLCFCSYPFAIPVVGTLRSLTIGESLLTLIVLGHWSETCFFHLSGGSVTLCSVATYLVCRCRRRTLLDDSHRTLGILLSVNVTVHIFLGICQLFDNFPFRTTLLGSLAASWAVTSAVGHFFLKALQFLEHR